MAYTKDYKKSNYPAKEAKVDKPVVCPNCKGAGEFSDDGVIKSCPCQALK